MDIEDVVSRHGRALLRVAYLLCHDVGRAEDLLQESLLKAHRHWSRHGVPEYPQAYLRRMIVTEYLGWRRRRWSTEVVGLGRLELTADDDVATVDERDLAWRAMAALPARQRAVLVLRYYESLPDAQIAELLGCADATVRSHAARGLAALRTDPSLSAATLPEVTP